MESKKARKYLRDQYEYSDLTFELDNIMEWLDTKPKYASLSEKLTLIKYMSIPVGILVIVFFLVALFSFPFMNLLLSIIAASIAGSLTIVFIILLKLNNKLLQSIFTEYCLESPEIELIDEGTWIYKKKYHSFRSFAIAFIIYTLLMGVILFFFVFSYFEDPQMGLLVLPFGCLFGLIFGIMFGLHVFHGTTIPLYFLGITLSPFCLFLPISGYQYKPLGLLMIIPFILALIGSYAINKLIYQRLESDIEKKMAADLLSYFSSYESIFLPTWKWMNTEDHLRILGNAIQNNNLDLTIEDEYLKKL